MKAIVRPRVPALLAALGLLVVVAALGQGGTVTAAINPVEMQILGQDTWLADSRVGVRVVLRHHETGEPLPGRIILSAAPRDDPEAAVTLYQGRTDAGGSTQAEFATDRLRPGEYILTARAHTPEGWDRVEQPVRVQRMIRILLTTDKPLYQPGQTIHMRALALLVPSLKPASPATLGEAGAILTLEVEDAKGNKVFKYKGACSKFGVAHADFTLAHELNMGRFTIRALIGGAREEKTVTVERYVLPKFKVKLATDRKYYRPGERVTGRVQADYFFGKPVDGGKVEITGEAFETGWRTVAEITGKTDAQGSYRYELELPDYLVGQPSEGGGTAIKLTAAVTDRADHTQQISQSVPVSQNSLSVRLVPEGGALKPDVPNTIYVLTSTPDGQAAPAQVTLRPQVTGSIAADRPTFDTDENGLAAYHLGLRGARESLDIAVEAHGKAGDFSGTVTLPCARYGQYDQPVALALDRGVAKVGDEVTATAYTVGKAGFVFLDVVKDGQTMLTRTMPVKDGRARTSLTLGPALAGMVTFTAYRLSPSENIIRDSRRLWVEAADDLRIEVKPGKQSYRPGEEASVAFRVTDRGKHPVLAALGIAVVDESVFALAESQPGLEQLYFRLERELMAPRYEVHGLELPSVLREPPMPRPVVVQERDLAARVLFASAPEPGNFSLAVNSFTRRMERLRKQMEERLEADSQRISTALRAYYQRHGEYLQGNDLQELVREGLLPARALKDQFGSPYRAECYGEMCVLHSAGPDRKFDTPDDVDGRQIMVKRRMVKGARFEAAMVEDMAVGGRLAEARPMAAAGPPGPAGPVGSPGKPAEPAVRVREYFPETMFWQPALITDDQGRATLKVPMADSITTWRLTALGSSLAGRLGSVDAPLRCFQDFFVDLDLPVALTQGDQVSVPVAVYNYLPAAQTVTLTLEQGDWFDLQGEPVQRVRMEKNGVDVVHYTLTAKGIGLHKLTVRAQGSAMSDAIRREIEVLPDGKEIRTVQNGRLEAGKPIKTRVELPAAGIDGAGTIFVKLYPGTFSQVVEGLDKILRMPNGCFEQTSSVTYPNVLVLDYLNRTRQAKPELAMKAGQYINVGYQRLVSYEVQGGGFSWFGDAPAHQVLTAYGLLEFKDMSRVHEVDPAVIARTQQWLAGRQQGDGTWKRDEGGIAEGIINRQTDTLRVTGYITWALAETGYQGAQLGKALDWLRAHYAEAKDPYALAVILNAFTAAGERGAAAAKVAEMLAAQAVVEGDTAYWKSGDATFTGAGGQSADLETTALAAYALLQSGQQGGVTNKALLYLTKQKDSYGTWSTTQATVWAMKALLLAMERGTEDTEATITVLANGKRAGEFRITPEDADVMRQLDLGDLVHEGDNDIILEAKGKGSVLYQVVSKFYLPWDMIRPGPQDILKIDVSYDRTDLQANDLLGCRVEVKNLTDRLAKMVVVDLGLPPGFDLVPDGLEAALKAKTITKYTPAARQIIVYTEGIAPRATLTLNYQLRAKYPLKARTGLAKAYPYYNPEQEALAAPKQVVVR